MSGRGRHRAGLFGGVLYAVLVGGGGTACTSVDTVLLTGETFPPKASVSDVEVLEQEPTRPHIQIAELGIASIWLSEEHKRQKILEKAATLGADAVVFSEPGLRPLAQRESPLGYYGPPSGSGSKGAGGFGSDDVRIVLVRGGGGGHGGGRGGGRGGGHRGGWGGMRGRSAPSSVRPWGRYYAPHYGPRYWGYGPYGPGGWGYAPFWGGYDPLWSGYAPFEGSYAPFEGNYGPFESGYAPYLGLNSEFVNTLLIGTAIRYTEPPGP
jgi:hypothetical protein